MEEERAGEMHSSQICCCQRHLVPAPKLLGERLPPGNDMDSENGGVDGAGKAGKCENKKASAGFPRLRFTEFDSGGLSDQTEYLF